MRIAVISDIHGNLRALEGVLHNISERSVDLTVNLGDCVTSPLWPRETLELLDTLTAWSDEMLKLDTATLTKVLKLGAKIKKLISSEPTAGERSRRSEITAAHLLGP